MNIAYEQTNDLSFSNLMVQLTLIPLTKLTNPA